MSEQLPKPFTKDQIEEALQKLLKMREFGFDENGYSSAVADLINRSDYESPQDVEKELDRLEKGGDS